MEKKIIPKISRTLMSNIHHCLGKKRSQRTEKETFGCFPIIMNVLNTQILLRFLFSMKAALFPYVEVWYSTLMVPVNGLSIAIQVFVCLFVF